MSKLTILFLFLLTACAGADTYKKKISLDNVYISSGVERYFLTDLPEWANFSVEGKCFRSSPVKYLDFKRLKSSYNLNYEQMISLQHTFNKKIEAYKKNAGEIPLKDEVFIFSNSYEEILGGARDFMAPKYNKISLIWIDSYLGKNEHKLKRLFADESLLDGHPVFISTCLSALEMESLILKLKLEEFGVKSISADMFSMFDKEGQRKPGYYFYLEDFFKNKDITFIGPVKKIESIIGINKFIER